MTDEFKKSCPLRTRRTTMGGCCTWGDFYDGLKREWAVAFYAPPTPIQWDWAYKDWRYGLSGAEAVDYAVRRKRGPLRGRSPQ